MFSQSFHTWAGVLLLNCLEKLRKTFFYFMNDSAEKPSYDFFRFFGGLGR